MPNSLLCLLLAAPLVPLQDDVDSVLLRLQPNIALRRLNLEVIEGAGPFQLYHEVPADGADVQRIQVETIYAPWLRALGARLAEDVWSAVGVEGPLGTTVVVTRRASGFRSMQSTMVKRVPAWERSAWLSDVETLVTYHDQNKRDLPTVERYSLLRLATLRLLLARSTAGENPVGYWAVEGLAGAFVQNGVGDRPEVLGQARVPRTALDYLGKILSSESQRRGLLLPLSSLLELTDAKSRHLAVSRLALEAGLSAPNEEASDHLVRMHSELWVHYLAIDAKAKHRSDFLAYVRRVLGGVGDTAAFEATLGVAPASLEAGFRKWAQGRARALKEAKARAVVEAAVRGEETGEDQKAAEEALLTSDPIAAGPRAWPLEGARHPNLIAPSLDLDGHLASVIALASEGKLEAALVFMDSLASTTSEQEDSRLATEHARVESMLALRSKFLASLPGTPKRLRLVEGDTTVPCTVKEMKDGVLKLGSNRAGLAAVEVDSVGAADLLASLGSKGLKQQPPWLVSYMQLLAGEAFWSKELGADSPEAKELIEQGARLAALRPQAQMRRDLARLAHAPLPERPEEMREGLDLAGALASELGPREDLESVHDGLVGLGTELADALFDYQGIRLALAVEPERMAGDRVRLVYEFDDPAQLVDFPTNSHTHPWIPAFPLDADSLCLVKDGTMRLRGLVSRRFRLPLELAKVTYTVRLTDPMEEVLGQSFQVLLCLDAEQPWYALAVNAHDLFIVGPVETLSQIAEIRSTIVHRPFTMTLQRHDNGDVTLEGEGRSARIDGRQLTGTDVAFQIYSNHIILVERIELEGGVSEAARAKMKATWISEELARLGLR